MFGLFADLINMRMYRQVFFYGSVFFICANAYAYRIGNIDITLRSRIQQMYDDNVTFASINKKEDFITVFTIGMDARYAGKMNSLELITDITRNTFVSHQDFNNTSEDVTLRFQREFSKFDRISLRDSFTHAEEPRSFEDEFGRTSGRYSYYRNNFNISYTRDISKSLSFNLRYANRIYAVSREDMSDSYFNNIGFDASYIFGPRTIATFSYDYEHRKFDPGAKSYIHKIAALLRRYITPHLYFDISSGVSFAHSYSGENYSQPLFAFSLAEEVNKNSRVGLSFVKEYATNSYTANIFDRWSISMFFVYDILERLQCSFSFFYSNVKYKIVDIADKYFGSRISFIYDISDNLRGDISYSYSNTSSDVDLREYRKNKVSLGIKWEF